MDRSPDDPDAAKDPDGSDREPGLPGWVKGFVIAGIVVAVVIVVGLLIGTGDHGPWRHSPGNEEAKFQAPTAYPPTVDMDRR